jgi:hypothetical protein
MFRALLAEPQDAIHKRHLVYCVRYVSWLHLVPLHTPRVKQITFSLKRLIHIIGTFFVMSPLYSTTCVILSRPCDFPVQISKVSCTRVFTYFVSIWCHFIVNPEIRSSRLLQLGRCPALGNNGIQYLLSQEISRRVCVINLQIWNEAAVP